MQLDDRSERALDTVHPELRVRTRKVVNGLIDAGYPAKVTSGLRTHAEQTKLYNQGRSNPKMPKVTNARAGFSNHNYGLANDITIFLFDGKPDWKNETKGYPLIGKLAARYGLEWGGNWGNVDMPHVQLKGLGIKQCQQLYAKGNNTLDLVWAAMDKILGITSPASSVSAIDPLKVEIPVMTPTEDDILELGDRGPVVREYQQKLVLVKRMHSHEVDGIYGKVTKNATIGLQRQHGLQSDGIAGPKTRAALEAELKSFEAQKAPTNP